MFVEDWWLVLVHALRFCILLYPCKGFQLILLKWGKTVSLWQEWEIIRQCCSKGGSAMTGALLSWLH
eukprot:15366734-Ditylum_brightwellii.AAC.2